MGFRSKSPARIRFRGRSSHVAYPYQGKDNARRNVKGRDGTGRPCRPVGTRTKVPKCSLYTIDAAPKGANQLLSRRTACHITLRDVSQFGLHHCRSSTEEDPLTNRLVERDDLLYGWPRICPGTNSTVPHPSLGPRTS